MDNKLVELAKSSKEAMAKLGGQNKNEAEKALRSHVVLEKDDEIIMYIITSECNKYEALRVAEMCKLTLKPDAISLILDANVQALPPDIDREKLDKKLKNWPEGLLQSLMEAGKGEQAGIRETLIIQRMNKDGDLSSKMLLYTERNGSVFWDEDVSPDPDPRGGEKVEGFMPNSLAKIMGEPQGRAREIADTLDSAAKVLELPKEKREYHTLRGVVQVLEQWGCTPVFNRFCKNPAIQKYLSEDNE